MFNPYMSFFFGFIILSRTSPVAPLDFATANGLRKVGFNPTLILLVLMLL